MSKLGVAVIGLNGAVASTAAAGIAALRAGHNDMAGLPLADRKIAGMRDYRELEFAGWDLDGRTLAEGADANDIVPASMMSTVREELSAVRPWPAIGSQDFCANIDGDNKLGKCSHRDAIARIQDDLARFRDDRGFQDWWSSIWHRPSGCPIPRTHCLPLMGSRKGWTGTTLRSARRCYTPMLR